MKKLMLLMLMANWTFAQEYQKTIEKTLTFEGQSVKLDVSFASNINIKTWDKNEVYLKADIAMEKEAHLNLYGLDIDNGSSTIHIEENTKRYFDALKREWEEKNGKQRYCCNSEYEFNYVLYVPKSSHFKVSSINGSMESEIIEGNFEAELINGDIYIKKYAGKLNLSTINGAIDLNVKGAYFVAETINGNIYADDNLELKTYDKYVGQKVESTSSAGSTKLKLNTINGNMYLRL